jgi:hypothetical protein
MTTDTSRMMIMTKSALSTYVQSLPDTPLNRILKWEVEQMEALPVASFPLFSDSPADIKSRREEIERTAAERIRQLADSGDVAARAYLTGISQEDAAAWRGQYDGEY